MAEKAKAKKAKALAKKSTSLRPKKKEISVKDAYHEADAEQLELAQEALPKRGTKSKPADKEKKIQTQSVDKEKSETKSVVVEDKPAKVSAPEIIAPIQPRVVLNKPVHPVQESRSEVPQHEARPQRNQPQPNQNQNSSQNQNQGQNQNQNQQQNQNQKSNQSSSGDGLKVRLSESLVKKLKEQSADEGISLEEFIAELLAESVVLRAWEIVERKNAMKGPSSGQGPTGGGGRNYNNQGGGNKGNPNQRGGPNQGGGGQNQGGGNKGHRGMSHVRYQSIMDDKATFLEYVRSQEKTRR